MSESREENRKEALGRAIQQIEKSYGKGTLMHLTDQAAAFDGIPTGTVSLDIALGGYGIPRGRGVEIFGPESSGKTTLTLHILAEAQKLGGVCAFIDAEHAFDPSWAKRLGVNLEELLVNQPNSGEEALEICEMLVRSNSLDVIVIDSVAALVTKHELEGQMGDAQVGAQARLMSQALRKLTALSGKSRTSVLFINQLREKIGVMYGNPETTPGGRALKFYSSVRLDVRRIGFIKEGDVTIGTRVKTKVAKNKIAPPFREAEFDILFECGISKEADLIDVGTDCGVLTRAGTWYTFGEIRLGQGRDNARVFLRANPDMVETIRKLVLEARMPKPAATETKADKSDKPAAAKPETDRISGRGESIDKKAKAEPASRNHKPVRPALAGVGKR